MALLLRDGPSDAPGGLSAGEGGHVLAVANLSIVGVLNGLNDALGDRRPRARVEARRLRLQNVVQDVVEDPHSGRHRHTYGEWGAVTSCAVDQLAVAAFLLRLVGEACFAKPRRRVEHLQRVLGAIRAHPGVHVAAGDPRGRCVVGVVAETLRRENPVDEPDR